MLDKKGGYLIINYGEKGSYEKLTRSNKKVVLLTGLEENAQWMSVYTDEDSYVLVNENYVIGIDDEGNFTESEGLYQGYSGANASTKKIYCHPIVITKNATVKFSCAFLLFNNDSNKIDTYDKLKTELFRIAGLAGGTANIICTGKIANDVTSYVVSHIYVTSDAVRVYGLDASNSYGDIVITNETPEVLVDGVNPIN